MAYGENNIIEPEMGNDLASPQAPLFMRMAENMPALSHTMAFNVRRFENTMFKGGFLDRDAVSTGRMRSAYQTRRAAKYGSFIGDTASPASARAFSFSKFRGASAAAAGKTPFIKQSLKTNFGSPRAVNRLGSVTGLTGMPDATGFYSPFQGAKVLGMGLEKVGLRGALESRGIIDSGTKEDLMAGGVLGRMSTMQKAFGLENKADKLTTKVASRTAAGKGGGRFERRLGRVDKKLAGLDKSLVRLQNVTPGTTSSIVTGATATGGTGVSSGASKVGRLRAISNTQGGVFSRSMTESLGVAMNPSQFQGTKAFQRLEKAVISAFSGNTAAASEMLSGTGTSFNNLGKFGDKVSRGGPLGRILPKKSNISVMAKMADDVGDKAAARVLRGQLYKKGAAFAMRSLSVVGNAALVYDLGKLAGKGVLAGGNFAKDAVKSMQGSMNKPLFGMGFRDNEVAATSRARGVAAIQNSRLNARSMLGSEAGMMAAHFG
jgi:hypothetical protein